MKSLGSHATLAATVVATALVWITSSQIGVAQEPVTFDVVVTDAKSRPVLDLRASDIEVVDAGETRSVDSVQVRQGGPRVFGILLDEFHVHAGPASARVRDALLAFIETQYRDGDSVAIVKPLDPLHAIAFMQDRTVIRQVIAGFEGHSGDYTPRTEFERNFMSRDPKIADASRAQVVSAALQALARRLGDQQPGRKALIFVSEGFRPESPRAIVSAAIRNHVAIYSIDPDPAADDDDVILRSLADQTGGFSSVNEANLAPGLSQVTSDLDNHLIVSFTAQGPEDGRFHPVQVRIKRAGLQARTRTGYWAVDSALTAALTKANTPTPTAQFRPSRSSPYIRPWIGMSRGPDGLTQVTVTWEPGTAPPRNQRVTGVTLKATNSEGTVLFQQHLGPGDAERATFETRPGFVALEMAIQSSSGTELDTDYRSLSVPNMKVTKPTFATPQLIRTRTARQFADVSQNADAAPSASRSFSRTERLLVRAPAYGAGDSVPVVKARLLNRRGTVMRELELVSASATPGIPQFDLPLAYLAPDEYRLELDATNATGPREEVKEILTFRVTD